MTVRLDEMSWPEVKEVLSKPNAVILPLGSTEQHGTHLPINFDSFCATYIAEHAAQKSVDEHEISVLVAPTIDYTDVSVHKMFPGTIGVKPDTLIKVIVDVVRSFLDQGFNNIIALTAHRENDCPLVVALHMIAEDYPKANLFAVSTIDLGSDARPGSVKAGVAGRGHALEGETSKALIIEPQNVHLDKAQIGARELPLSERYIGAHGMDRSKGVIYCSGLKGFEKTGTFGDPTMASKEEGEKILLAQISDLVDIIGQAVKV
ncbi:creatininase family protein [Chloroflexota bacterium]